MNIKRIAFFIGIVALYTYISVNLLANEIIISIIGAMFAGLATNLYIFERQKLSNLGLAFLKTLGRKDDNTPKNK